MLETTEITMNALLAADNTIPREVIQKAVALLKGENSDAYTKNTDDTDRIISREEVATIIGKSVQTVDIYGRRGVIRRVYLPGASIKRHQAQGYSRKSVLDALAQGLN